MGFPQFFEKLEKKIKANDEPGIKNDVTNHMLVFKDGKSEF